MDFSTIFNQKTYLVTGATSGIGHQVASDLMALGARVVFVGRDVDKVNKVIHLLSGHRGTAIPAVTSLDSVEEVSSFVKSLAIQYGPFDGCFHSAGVELIKTTRMLKNIDVKKILSPSLFAALGIASAFGSKNVTASTCSIVFMSSVSARAGQVGMALYASSKSAISGLVRSLACELSSKGVRVNSILAGAVMTEMHDRLTRNSSDDIVSSYEAMHLLGFGEKKDISYAGLFLLSNYSKWITGTELVVDGGYLCK